jgi:hypothetical protein
LGKHYFKEIVEVRIEKSKAITKGKNKKRKNNER